MLLVDSHCHLDYEPMISDINDTLARAESKGIKGFLTICTHLSKIELLKTITQNHEPVFATVGVHPHEAADTLPQKELAAFLIKEASHPKVVGFGETGLDYYYQHSPKDLQKQAFQAHVEAALVCDFPLIVHTRDAESDTIDLLRMVGKGKARGVMHCFSGSPWLRDQALDMGFYISVSGIATFKKAQDLQHAVQKIPLEKMLIETDCPYLAPEPFRGKKNEPAYVTYVAEHVARLRGLPVEKVMEQTTQNARELFGMA